MYLPFVVFGESKKPEVAKFNKILTINITESYYCIKRVLKEN